MKAQMLLNWTDEDFSVEEGFNRDEKMNIMWETHTLKVGEQRYFPGYLADYIAKHLIDRELNKQKLITDHPSRAGLLAKCFPGDVIEAKSADSLSAVLMNQKETKAPEQEEKPAAKKPGRPKKVVVEEAFAGLAP